MSFVEVNPRYQGFLEEQGLVHADEFLALSGHVVRSHADRQVVRVRLGNGAAAFTAFLKREDRVAWKDRLANACSGFGFVSKSYREAGLLRSLQRAGVGCPEMVAAGEDADGHAFVLVRELDGARDLVSLLQERRDATPQERRRFARVLGEALAHLHDTGFEHPDLTANHVLVDATGETVRFLDWQHSRRRRHVSWSRRWRDLAALHATLTGELATPRERLVCLRAYLRATLPVRVPRHFLERALATIIDHAGRLLQLPHVRDLRLAARAAVPDRLEWEVLAKVDPARRPERTGSRLSGFFPIPSKSA
jgi:tRNA A-37 threonylcarbamoyl transferase component Bud32